MDTARSVLFLNSINKYLLNTNCVPGTVLGAGIPIGNKGNEVSILKDLSGEDGPNTRKQTHKINPNCGKSYERNKHMVEIENQQQCLL